MLCAGLVGGVCVRVSPLPATMLCAGLVGGVCVRTCVSLTGDHALCGFCRWGVCTYVSLHDRRP